jgi:hypothetical protein
MTTEKDSVQQFAVLELVLPIAAKLPEKPEAWLNVDNQSLMGYFANDGTVRFRYSPKSPKTFSFVVKSNVPKIDGKTGGVMAYIPPLSLAKQPSDKFPNWWTDDCSPEFAEGEHIGAKTVSKWRGEFLKDFARRMERCAIASKKE